MMIGALVKGVRVLALAGVVSLAMVGQSFAQDKSIKLSTLIWPPYAMKDLPEGGALISLITKMFEDAGYSVEIEYHPFARAIHMAKSDPSVAGVIALPQPFATGELVGSEVFNVIDVGFMQMKDKPITWADGADLKALKIGSVNGYAHGEQVDTMLANGELTFDMAPEDSQNLKKMIAGRLDAMVVDPRGIRYRFAVDPEFSAIQDSVSFNEKLLVQLPLVIGFKNTDEGKTLAAEFNAMLAKTDAAAHVNSYFAQFE